MLISAGVMAQRPGKSRIQLVRADKQAFVKGANGKLIYKFKNATFKQDFSTLTSDSSIFYSDDNLVDAFGHVIINQGDTLHIFSDKLHYDGNTKLATLTGNVKMVDKDATLLTDYFTYNTATKFGTYTGGGKLFNNENTLTSKNGYYLAGSRDAYFRHDVVLTTPDALIKTDTLRYNSGSRIAWFYGPTNIYGTKDKDVLYTEDGRYETIPEQAFFGKKNLYTQGTKSLKGDSLFYDRLKGYGKAVKNVVFDDKEQHITVKGHLGEYYKAAERAIITQNPYVIFVTQDSSKTAANAKKDSLNKKADSTALASVKKDTSLNKAIANSITPAQKNVVAKIAAQPNLKAVTDSVMKAAQNNTKLPLNIPAQAPNAAINTAISNQIAAAKKAAEKNGKIPASIPAQIPNTSAKVNAAINNVITEERKNAQKKATPQTKADSVKAIAKDSVAKRAAAVDSMYLGADTIDTRIITFKELKELKMARYLIDNPDIAANLLPSIILTKDNWPKVLVAKVPHVTIDTSFIKPDFFSPKPKQAPKPVVKATPEKVTEDAKTAVKTTDAKTATNAADKKSNAANVNDPKNTAKKTLSAEDSLALNPNKLRDTSRVRIIMGYHAAKIYKSDLQAKADSLFYASSDSTIRMYVNPIIWTQGSQLTGDTIALQMKNRKLDNVDLFPNGFIVNIEKNDSLHFNQAGGRKIHGTFKDSRLNTMDIDGNAQTIYYNRDSVKNVVTEMIRSMSTTVKTSFKAGKLYRGNTYGNTENKVYPVRKLKDDDKILKGFIWKPKERPASKEAITGTGKKTTSPPTPVATAGKKSGTAGTTPGKKDDGKKPVGTQPTPAAADTTEKKEAPMPITYEVLISN